MNVRISSSASWGRRQRSFIGACLMLWTPTMPQLQRLRQQPSDLQADSRVIKCPTPTSSILLEFDSTVVALMFCEDCGAPSATLRCGRCREAYYCNITCQKHAWKKGHKHKCVTNAAGTQSAKPHTAAAAAAAAAAATAPCSGDSGGEEECAICLEALQRPQTMPCGHRFCRGCVAGMRQHGVAVAQVCPLCRGAMPDAERMSLDAANLLAQYGRKRGGLAQLQQLPVQAERLLRQALAIDPENLRARNNLGGALKAMGDLDGAEAAFRAAIAADPMYADPQINLGGLLSDRGDKAGSEAAYRAVIAADPQHAKALFNLGVSLRGHGPGASARAAYRAATTADVAGAEAAYRAAISADPLHADAHCCLGAMLADRGDEAGALAAYRAAIAADPQHPHALNNLGIMMRQRGHEAGAEAAYRAAIAADPQEAGGAHNNLGGLLEARGDVAGAEAAYRTGTAAGAGGALAYGNLGCILHERGDGAGAEAAYRAAIAADPLNAAGPYHNLGALLSQRGDHAGAASSFAAALKFNESASHASAKANLRAVLEKLKYEDVD